MIYVFFAHGFEEVEAITAVDLLRRAELEVQSVGVGSKTVTGSHGITVHCDIADREVNPRGLKMIVLPGGMPGTVNLEKSPVVKSFIEYAFQDNLWVGAICAAPSILGHMNLLEGRRVTCFPGFDTQLGEGAVYTGERVERDGRLITGKGPGASIPFALGLVEALTDAERAAVLEASLQ